jgi:predicted small metal-binding protein
MKLIHCRDLGFACDQQILAESEEEVLRQAAEHAYSLHGVQVTPEMASQVQSHILDLSDTELEQIIGGRQPIGYVIKQGLDYQDNLSTPTVDPN